MRRNTPAHRSSAKRLPTIIDKEQIGTGNRAMFNENS